MYIARQLSFHGVTFFVKEVPLSEDFIDMYDAAVELVGGGQQTPHIHTVTHAHAHAHAHAHTHTHTHTHRTDVGIVVCL